MEDNKTLDDVLDGVIDPKDPEPEQEPEKDPEVEPENPPEEEPEKDPETDPEPEEDPDPEADKKPKKEDSSVIRNLRQQQKESSKQVKEYDQMLEKIAKQQGISKDELVEKLQTEADEKEAKEKNISPEIQKKMREQDEALKNLQQERQRDIFNNKYDRLIQDYPMEPEEGKAFVQAAIDMGVDLGSPNTDFKAVYRAINHDALLEQARADEREKTLKRIEEQGNKSPGITKKRSQSDGAKKGGLNDALSEIIG